MMVAISGVLDSTRQYNKFNVNPKGLSRYWRVNLMAKTVHSNPHVIGGCDNTPHPTDQTNPELLIKFI